jgi:beta-galactosidase/beta-glucuronidase
VIGTDTGRRRRVDLDGEWRFVPDPERMHAPDRLPEGEPILVPGCWEAQVARPYGIVTAWYRRRMAIPADWEGHRVVLHFQAVMYRCAVFIDAHHIGGH